MDEDLAADLGPPPEAVIVLAIAPVSLQGGADAKETIREAVRKQAERYDRLFVGEVEVTVEWLVHEERRWDTRGVLRSPDVDNIVKPLVDGLCGPRGLILDDCQVQSIHCHWIDWPDRENQQITVRVRTLMVDDWINRGPITGLRMADGMCWINSDDLPLEVQAVGLGLVAKSRGLYEQAVANGIPPEQARYFLPVARRYHPEQLTRHGFPVGDFDEYLRELEAQGYPSSSATT